jgi:ABC-type Fe3+/spermidine/putrescine transport system ATPase subunit
MAETETMIDMRGIVKSYAMGKERLTFAGHRSPGEQGEFVAILGPSGSGKSTLMNIIGCMDLPDSGEYYLSGIRIHGSSYRELTKIRNRQIGFVFQKYQLISKYKVLETWRFRFWAGPKPPGRLPDRHGAHPRHRPGGPGEAPSQPAFGRTAAAGSHRQGAGGPARGAVGR